MEQLIKWLEANPDLVIAKLKKNEETFINLETDVVILNKILCPSTALELAEIYEEYLNTIAVLEIYEVNLPSDVKARLKKLFKEGLVKLTELAEKEANNDGNFSLFINAVIEKEPVPMELINITNNMVGLNFRSHEEGVV